MSLSLVPNTVVYVLQPDIQPSSIPIPDDSYCEIVPATVPRTILPKHYGYPTDSLWEITMSLEWDRESRRNHVSRIRNTTITEEETVTYLLAIPENIFQLHIKSTKILCSSTNGEGSCGFRALRQASTRAGVPVHQRAATPIGNVDYTNKPKRLAQFYAPMLDGSKHQMIAFTIAHPRTANSVLIARN